MIADAHNDLLMELVHRRAEERPFERHWLQNLLDGGIGLQVCPLFADVEEGTERALADALAQTTAFRRAVAECPDRVAPVRTRADLDALDGRIGLLLSLEGCEALGSNPELIEVFWELGVRMVSLTWNRRNAFADGAAEPGDGGLSQLGRELVGRLVELGALIDLAHASERTFADVLDAAPAAPVLVSHAGCRAIVDTPRNVSDDQLRALAERDGVFCVMALPVVVDPQRPTIERVVDHVDHAVEVMGIAHVGLGGDFIRQVALALGLRDQPAALLPEGMSIADPVEGLAGPEDYPALIDELRRRGYAGAELDAILSGNLLRLLRRALPA
ncbi:MAG TPA: membrane dipeptidase [Gaiellaceae bacterium]